MFNPMRFFLMTLAVCLSFAAVMATVAGAGVAVCAFVYGVLGFREFAPLTLSIFAAAALCFVVFALVFRSMIMLFRKPLPGNAGGGHDNTAETALMQELHQGLAGLEGRIESLETLLLERSNPSVSRIS